MRCTGRVYWQGEVGRVGRVWWRNECAELRLVEAELPVANQG